jgi:hypothetical protein
MKRAETRLAQKIRPEAGKPEGTKAFPPLERCLGKGKAGAGERAGLEGFIGGVQEGAA